MDVEKSYFITTECMGLWKPNPRMHIETIGGPNRRCFLRTNADNASDIAPTIFTT